MSQHQSCSLHGKDVFNEHVLTLTFPDCQVLCGGKHKSYIGGKIGMKVTSPFNTAALTDLHSWFSELSFVVDCRKVRSWIINIIISSINMLNLRIQTQAISSLSTKTCFFLFIIVSLFARAVQRLLEGQVLKVEKGCMDQDVRTPTTTTQQLRF